MELQTESNEIRSGRQHNNNTNNTSSSSSGGSSRRVEGLGRGINVLGLRVSRVNG